MNGKDKCRILKDIRRQIAESNDIEWVVSECTHKGSCKGTCPKCESEVRKLERELSLRRKLGKAVAVAGVSAACVAGLTGCSLEDVVDFGHEIVDTIKDSLKDSSGGGIKIERPTEEEIELDGDVAYIDDLQGMIEPYEEPTEEDFIETLDGEVAIDYYFGQEDQE